MSEGSADQFGRIYTGGTVDKRLSIWKSAVRGGSPKLLRPLGWRNEEKRSTFSGGETLALQRELKEVGNLGEN